MAITTAAADDELTSSLWNELANLINGTAGGDDPVKFIRHNDASVYSLTVSNVDTTNGYALKVEYGAVGSATEIATFAKAAIAFTPQLQLNGGSTLRMGHIATPSAPGADRTIFYPKSDGLLYFRSGAAGAETAVGTMVNPMTTLGDLIVGAASGSPTRLAIGTARQVLQVDAAATGHAYAASLQSLMTTTGDVVYAASANTPTRLALGTARQTLAVDAGATGLAYQNSLQSLMTTTGDIVYAASANTPTRLAIGTSGQVLFGGTTPAWSNLTQRPAVAVGTTDPTTTATTAVALADPTITITTTGGDVLVWARMAINSSTANIVNMYVRESIANAFVLIGEVSPPSSSGRQTVSGFHRFTSLAATSHTFDIGWAVSTGTSTSFGSGTGRRLMAIEIKA